MEEPIFLTGFMGTGKSKIGFLLSCFLRRDFVDTDQLIEKRAGQTIPEIFASKGEAVFRQVEHQCVAEAAECRNAVIALGGGAITQECNCEVIRQTGVLVCLQASPETIFERVNRKEDRPLLAGLSAEERLEKIRHLLAERAPFYERADITIQSNNEQTPETVVSQLVELLEQWYEKNNRGS